MKDIHKNDRIVAFLAGAMALISLSVAIWDGIETRHHNRLSVRPFLTFNLTNSTTNTTVDDKVIVTKSETTITVINKGLGPARIKSFKITTFNAGKTMFHEDWGSALKALEHRQESIQTGSLDDASVLRADDTVLLVTLDTNNKNTAFIQIEIVYQSIYEEQFVASSDRIEI